MDKYKIGFALCGSYCTYQKVLPVVRRLAKEYEILPIMSENAYSTDTRFGTAQGFIDELTAVSYTHLEVYKRQRWAISS